ncbi:ENDD1 protein, partial [Smithornis capensis]|nr:ENDD1 protein [Smithornis capensis]
MLWLLLQVWVSCFWMGHSEVVTSFENSCPEFFYKNIPPNEGLRPQTQALICQRYKNQSFFATLYDRDRFIPVYSAYIYQPGDVSIHKKWMVEPQVSVLSYSMFVTKDLSPFQSRSGKCSPSRACTHSSSTGCRLDNKGHKSKGEQSHSELLFRVATFTLTNIVPQNISLNRGGWKNYEQKIMIDSSKGCKTTYVITGTVHGNMNIPGGRVNVPSHIWSSACCETNTGMNSWAVIAENDKDDVTPLTLGELEEMLAKLLKKGQVSLFHSECPRN